MTTGFFDDFSLEFIDTPFGKIRARIGGSGFPVLLLHGHPRTHTTWYQVAPILAEQFTVVCADLPGFGQSYQPSSLEGSSGKAKAKALSACMEALGHKHFGVAGHDRGAYRAFRLAMDLPGSVAGLVVMDGVPIFEVLERADWQFARDWWHWFFFAQSEKALAAIRSDPELWYPSDGARGVDNCADYLSATRDQSVIRGMLADYQAGLAFDYYDDKDDKEIGRRLNCPLGVLWSAQDDMVRLYGDPAEPWAQWSDAIIMKSDIPSGHHMAEEAPEAVADRLRSFFEIVSSAPG